jgi:hypothetical protein
MPVRTGSGFDDAAPNAKCAVGVAGPSNNHHVVAPGSLADFAIIRRDDRLVKDAQFLLPQRMPICFGTIAQSVLPTKLLEGHRSSTELATSALLRRPRNRRSSLFDTLSDMRAEGVRLHVNCSHPACCRSALVNLDMLIEKPGGDHDAMHRDLFEKFTGSACRDMAATSRVLHHRSEL